MTVISLLLWVYTTTAIVLEALRKTGNLEIKRNVFFEGDMMRNKGKVTHEKVFFYIQL